jgi:glycoprotein 2-beta-D-xylosyltransferase
MFQNVKQRKPNLFSEMTNTPTSSNQNNDDDDMRTSWRKIRDRVFSSKRILVSIIVIIVIVTFADNYLMRKSSTSLLRDTRKANTKASELPKPPVENVEQIEAEPSPAIVESPSPTQINEEKQVQKSSLVESESFPPVEYELMADPSPSWERSSDYSSCGGYFGNGFAAPHVLVESNSNANLQCSYHPQTLAFFCEAKQVIIYPSKITVSHGGESLDAVMGRQEHDELPVFESNSVEIYSGDNFDGLVSVGGNGAGDGSKVEKGTPIEPLLSAWDQGLSMNQKDPYKARMFRQTFEVNDEVLSSRPGVACKKIITEPVIFVTRVEYANLFHTSTDWYNVWQVARILNFDPTTEYSADALFGLTEYSREMETSTPRSLTRRIPVHVVFLDGHNACAMDEGWRSLFLSINYIKHFDVDTSGVCFSNSVFAPYGYHAAISQAMSSRSHDCFEQAHVRQFGFDMLSSLNIPPRKEAICAEQVETGSPLSILFVRRVHYTAHPRHDGKIVRRIDNEDSIYSYMEQKAAENEYSLLNGVFSSMSLKEQIQFTQDACIVMGAHGAGLSHVLFAPSGGYMLEIQPPAFQRPHFIAYSYWAGYYHKLWALINSTPEESAVLAKVVDLMTKIKTPEE